MILVGDGCPKVRVRILILGGLIAVAMVRGYQGDDLSKDNTILSCAKHFIAYGAAQAGRDYHTVDISERELRDTYLPPFKAAIDAGAGYRDERVQ